MSEADELAYSFPENDVSKLTCMRDINVYVNRMLAHEPQGKRAQVMAGLQERMLCSHWSDDDECPISQTPGL